jgi:hypothetical protein
VAEQRTQSGNLAVDQSSRSFFFNRKLYCEEWQNTGTSARIEKNTTEAVTKDQKETRRRFDLLLEPSHF